MGEPKPKQEPAAAPPAWTCVAWEEIGRDDLYDALALRQLVFAVEQACAYLDLDGVDRDSVHVLGRSSLPSNGGLLIAYARIVKPGVKYAEPSIGRVVTHPNVRRTGAGRALMIESIARSAALFGRGPIRISAQCYLERFYRELGFEPVGEPYSEDDIPHVEMLRP